MHISFLEPTAPLSRQNSMLREFSMLLSAWMSSIAYFWSRRRISKDLLGHLGSPVKERQWIAWVRRISQLAGENGLNSCPEIIESKLLLGTTIFSTNEEPYRIGVMTGSISDFERGLIGVRSSRISSKSPLCYFLSFNFVSRNFSYPTGGTRIDW